MCDFFIFRKKKKKETREENKIETKKRCEDNLRSNFQREKEGLLSPPRFSPSRRHLKEKEKEEENNKRKQEERKRENNKKQSLLDIGVGIYFRQNRLTISFFIFF